MHESQHPGCGFAVNGREIGNQPFVPMCVKSKKKKQRLIVHAYRVNRGGDIHGSALEKKTTDAHQTLTNIPLARTQNLLARSHSSVSVSVQPNEMH